MPALSDRYKILFILFVSLGIYYPSIFGQINSVDDQQMIDALINTDRVDLKELFFPFRPFDYYRPILWLSFLFDRFFFGCHEIFLHLNNIILHSINGVLIFLISKEINGTYSEKKKGYLPMFVSLLFVLHPINTEPVNFISGRTDLLAGFFVFSAMLIFLKYGIQSYFGCIVSALVYLLGLLSKEVALGMLPAIVAFLITKEFSFTNRFTIKKKIMLVLPFLFITFFYFIMRSIASGHSDAGITKAISIYGNDKNLLITCSGAIKAFGFYIKKLFIPLPLNFGIIDINRNFYFWFGLIMLFISLHYIIKKRNLLSFYLLFSFIFFLPALPVAVSRIAWTPLAERYLYISSFGIASFILLSIEQLQLKKNLVNGTIGILLILSAVITVNRNLIWQSNLSLYADTVKKSPDFAPARNEYGLALMNKGRYKEALEQFQIAKKLAGNIKYNEIPTLNIIAIEGLNKKPEDVKKEYLDLLGKSSNSNVTVEILKRVIKITEDQIRKETVDFKRGQLYREEIDYLERLFKLERNSFYIYRIGQFYLALNEKQRAKDYFKSTIELSPESYFGITAKRLLRNLN